MTAPNRYILTGYATEAQAVAEWASIKDNERLIVVGLSVGLGSANAAEHCACWCIMHKRAFEPAS